MSEILTVCSGKNRSAIRWAERAHRGQHRRSDPDVPYITHCIAVAEVAASIGASRNIVTACMLHDIVEDTEITLEQIFVEFGAEVAGIVDAVTKKEKVPLEQQVDYVMRSLLKSEYVDGALITKGCDLLVNMTDLVHDCEERGADFLKIIFDRPNKPRYEKKVQHYLNLSSRISKEILFNTESEDWADVLDTQGAWKLARSLMSRAAELQVFLQKARDES